MLIIIRALLLACRSIQYSEAKEEEWTLAEFCHVVQPETCFRDTNLRPGTICAEVDADEYKDAKKNYFSVGATACLVTEGSCSKNGLGLQWFDGDKEVIPVPNLAVLPKTKENHGVAIVKKHRLTKKKFKLTPLEYLKDGGVRVLVQTVMPAGKKTRLSKRRRAAASAKDNPSRVQSPPAKTKPKAGSVLKTPVDLTKHTTKPTTPSPRRKKQKSNKQKRLEQKQKKNKDLQEKAKKKIED